MTLRLIAILLFALIAPLSRAAGEGQMNTHCGSARHEVVADGADQTVPSVEVSPESSCCGTAGCQCGGQSQKALACGHQQPLSGAPCLCGCTGLPSQELPRAATTPVRVELSKVLVQTALLPLVTADPVHRNVLQSQAGSLRPGSGELFLLNLSIRT